MGIGKDILGEAGSVAEDGVEEAIKKTVEMAVKGWDAEVEDD